jgi:hypothetical protein
MPPTSPALRHAQTVLAQISRDDCLREPARFAERVQALDALEMLALDVTDNGLSAQIAALQTTLEAANDALCRHLRDCIRAGDTSDFRVLVRATADASLGEDVGYDALDLLVTGVLGMDAPPDAPGPLEADLVFYQPTPARVLLTLLDQLQPTSADVFCDVGSGLGHVPILAHLLTGVRARGIELEPAYVRYAQAHAAALNLPDVRFTLADARQADFSGSTIIYLYTPFLGDVLRQVLATLQAEAAQRPLTICTYGPCTQVVSQQAWLQPRYRAGAGDGAIGLFITV